MWFWFHHFHAYFFILLLHFLVLSIPTTVFIIFYCCQYYHLSSSSYNLLLHSASCIQIYPYLVVLTQFSTYFCRIVSMEGTCHDFILSSICGHLCCFHFMLSLQCFTIDYPLHLFYTHGREALFSTYLKPIWVAVTHLYRIDQLFSKVVVQSCFLNSVISQNRSVLGVIKIFDFDNLMWQNVIYNFNFLIFQCAQICLRWILVPVKFALLWIVCFGPIFTFSLYCLSFLISNCRHAIWMNTDPFQYMHQKYFLSVCLLSLTLFLFFYLGCIKLILTTKKPSFTLWLVLFTSYLEILFFFLTTLKIAYIFFEILNFNFKILCLTLYCPRDWVVSFPFTKLYHNIIIKQLIFADNQ